MDYDSEKTSGGNMKEKINIDRFFQKIIRRTQALTIGTAFFRIFSLLFLGLLCLAFVVYLKYPREYGQFVLVLFLALAFCSGVWALKNWFRDRSRLYLAKKVERLRPELRGSLLCAIELDDSNEPPPMIRQSILARAYTGLLNIPLHIMSSSRPFVSSVSSFGLVAILVLGF